MSFVINTNVSSLVAQQNLYKSNQMLNQAIERLSSGRKINSAADDAAGLAIANRMTAQIQGLSQARSNAADGISLAQTTEGALDQINENLQRIRELSVQAANGTLSDSDLSSIQDEIDQRLAEIDRISAQTTFNGVHVLAKDQEVNIQVGDDDDEMINIKLSKITSQTLGLASLDMTSQITSADLQEVETVSSSNTLQVDSFSFKTDATNMSAIVGQDGNLYMKTSGGAIYAADYNEATDTVTYDSSKDLASSVNSSGASFFTNDATGNMVNLGGQVNDGDTYFVNSAAKGDFEVYLKEASGRMVVLNTQSGETWGTSSGNIDSVINSAGQIDLTSMSAGTATAGALTTANYDQVTSEQLLDNGATTTAVDLSSVNLEGQNTLLQDQTNGNYYVKNVQNGETTYYAVANVDTGTGDVTLATDDSGNNETVVVNPLNALDEALAEVSELRSGLGAMQNRFGSAITNLMTTTTNLKAARSRIVDANYAKVVSQMSKAQILQQAGTSVLAQANQSQQSVLSLLR